MKNKVNIRPNVSMLSVLRFIEYETWYALAEFVDNSIASYQSNEKRLRALHGDNYQLKVRIDLIDAENKIVITDNAGGIKKSDYQRAFRAAEIPNDTSGLSEFGMGMKSAACWFSGFWIVRTTAIGEHEERTITFDMNKILYDNIEELEFTSKPVNEDYHYTTIELCNVNKMPRRKGIGKVKSHLTSIYREFIRKGTLQLKIGNDEQTFNEPKILKAKFQKKPYQSVGKPTLWKKDIDFPIDKNLKVTGFVAIREKASTHEAGFALFRRGRVIEGSFDNGFRPDFIFGSSNSFKYQRVFGELHLVGFDVSFTKKGIQWDENLDIFLKLLKDDISSSDFPLLQQAENYRARGKDKDYEEAGKKALDKTSKDFQDKAPKAIQETFEKDPVKDDSDSELDETDKILNKEFSVHFNKTDWRIFLELSYDPSLKNLIEVGNHLVPNTDKDLKKRLIGIRLSLTHPFMIQFVGTENAKIEPILRIIAALGLAEIIAKESGAKTQGEIRRNFNELITKIST